MGRSEASTQAEVYRLLAQGVALAQAGQRAQAYHLLLDVVELDQRNEQAWLWLSTVTDDLNDRRICLENVLTINPNHMLARERLAALAANGTQGGSAPSTSVICPQCGTSNYDFVRQCKACGYAFFRRCPACGEFNPTDGHTCDQCGAQLASTEAHTARSGQQPASATAKAPTPARSPAPLTLWPVVAFWTSVSVLFVGGGVASLFQFASILLRARGVLPNLSFIQIAWLPMGLFFIVFGLTGISLAWQLAQRRPGGYYGSLLFGLVLTLLGPSAGSVLDPPNYFSTVCTGLMPAAAVLLTLASMTGFESYANNP
jgi:hypothetical protein